MRNSVSKIGLLSFAIAVLFGTMGVAQTVAPPIAEYRNKAQGMFELRNDGDVPLAAILEVHGFNVDQSGTLLYEPLDSHIKVELGGNSFVIPPHQSHYVFYKATSTSSSAWFTILSTLTKAASAPNQMRINFVLPHVVYLYQKQKLKKDDITAHVSAGAEPGQYVVELENHSEKLGRVESVTGRGFEKPVEMGGFPIFPGKKRQVILDGGNTKSTPNVKVSFEDGFSLDVPLS
jgi:hypothetical protein